MLEFNNWKLQIHYQKVMIGAVIGVAVTPDGKTIVSASDDRMLKMWDLSSEQM